MKHRISITFLSATLIFSFATSFMMASLDEEIARENQQFAREKHNDNLEFAREDQQFSRENQRHHQRVELENQWFASENQECDLLIKRSKMKIQLALNQQKIEQAQAEKKRIKAESEKDEAENALRKCLVNNRYSSDLGLSGIPTVCEDAAKVLRLWRGRSEVDEIIEDFKK